MKWMSFEIKSWNFLLAFGCVLFQDLMTHRLLGVVPWYEWVYVNLAVAMVVLFLPIRGLLELGFRVRGWMKRRKEHEDSN